MKYRIATWSLVGFLVAAVWAFFAAATFPATSQRLQEVWAFVCLTCPIALAGLHHRISLYEVLVANAITYALVGLAVEALRKRPHHAQ